MGYCDALPLCLAPSLSVMLSGLIIPLSGESYSVVQRVRQLGENPAHAHAVCLGWGVAALSGPQLRMRSAAWAWCEIPCGGHR